MDVLYLVPPHGGFIASGKKTAIVQPNLTRDLCGVWMLVSGTGDGNALGHVCAGEPVAVTVEQFDSLFMDHRVTVKERERWWPDAAMLHLYPIEYFKPYDEPKSVVVPPGAQIVMRDVVMRDVDEGLKEVTMPWTSKNPPSCAKNWTEAEKKKCVKAANAVMRDGGAEQDAIFACIRAAGKTKHPGGKEDEKELSDLGHAIAAAVAEKMLAGGVAAKEEIVVTEEGDGEEEVGVTLEVVAEEEGEPEPEPGEPKSEPEPDEPKSESESVGEESESVEEKPEEPAEEEKKLGEGAGVGGPRQGVGGAAMCVCPECGHEVEHKRGTPCAEVKCPECGATMRGVENGDKVKKSILQPLRDAFDGFLTELGNVFKREKAVTQFAQPYLCKAADGTTWLVTWTTNAFIDREGEIFATDSIKEYVDRHRNEKVKGQFWYRHLNGTKFGDILYQGVAGRFLVEAGPFDDTPVGQAFKQLFEQYPNGHPVYSPEGWGCSHGYKYKEYDRRDRVYEWFEKRETSPLPARLASNPHNPRVEVVKMDQKDYDELVGMLGDDVAKRIAQLGDAVTEQKESEGVEHKEVKEQVDTDEQIGTDGIKRIVEVLHLDDLSDAVKAQSDAITTLTTEVSEMKKRLGEVERTDEERLAEKEQELPRFSWMRPSRSEATEVKDGDPIKSAMPSRAPGPVQALSDRMLSV